MREQGAGGDRAVPVVRGSQAGELSRDVIADAALAVMEREGVGGVSMRKVAAELGVQAPSLYWHVRNKEELLDQMADALFRHLELALPTGTWREQVTAMMHGYRAFLLSRRDAARLLGGRFVVGPHSSRVTERVLRTVQDAGFSRADSAYALYVLGVVYVQGFVLQETVPMSAAEALGATPEEALGAIAASLRRLPPEEFPATAASLDLLTRANLDDRFAWGLERILDGLEVQLARSAGAAGATAPGEVACAEGPTRRPGGAVRPGSPPATR